jgi:hypothetical protein
MAVTITPLPMPAADLPDDADCDVLIEGTIARHPVVGYVDDRYTDGRYRDGLDPVIYRAMFRRAMRYFAYVGRADKASDRGATWWLDECVAWLEHQGLPKKMLVYPFVAAAIASGIGYEEFEQPGTATLYLHLGSTGRPDASWRQSLVKIPEPTQGLWSRSTRVIQTAINWHG